MLNKYPLWKNLLVIVVLAIGTIYALPNLYPDDYAVQITGARSSTEVDQRTLDQAVAALDTAGISVKSSELQDRAALIRVNSAEAQLRAKPVVQKVLGERFLVALNMAASTPDWLQAVGAGPMKLGLDLRGGVHFLLEVDVETALRQRLEAVASQIKQELRGERIRYRSGEVTGPRVVTLVFPSEEERSQAFDLVRDQYNQFLLDERRDLVFPSEEERSQAFDLVRDQYNQFLLDERRDGDNYLIDLTLSEQEVSNIQEYALQQNLTTIRNRVNELGVAEPLVQRQGASRIVVELPGVQDTAQAKRVLGATANLEFRLEAAQDAPGSETETYSFRDEPQRTARLERSVIATGNNVSNAQQAFDQNGQPQVNISMDAAGGDMMNRVTRNAVGRRMAVLFIEFKTETEEKEVNGELVTEERRVVERGIISLATIQSALGSSFRITGLDSIPEASELALLLRAGSLAAPMYFVQERTIGPSLGQENINAGVMSVAVGFLIVLLYMMFYYRAFGLIANIALTVNLILLLACMSILSATLTLPGIAGIVLTVGMAVDANVLIFERIREELRSGMAPQLAINAGYSRAFVSIVDANVTTLLVAIILFAMGTGPVKGFAITLSLGILTSMFTGIVVSRAIVNLVYGGRKVNKLMIGGRAAHG